MSCYIDVAYDSLNKFGEELCGDKVDIIRNDDYTIIVLADGLGSGVKANILATLTAKIAGTMLKEGASIYETVGTIVDTLPVCKIRNIAYSTFTLMKIYNDGKVYIAEYDNPPFFLISNKSCINITKEESVVEGKIVRESNFYLKEGDSLIVCSDGVVHAGVGNTLNLGWQWDNIADYLKCNHSSYKCAKAISKDLVEVCSDLYFKKPGDDTTVVVVKLIKPSEVDIFTGPPADKKMDEWVIKKLIGAKGKKVVCGGTAANIAVRELNAKLKVSMELIDPEVPPIAFIDGIDMVTEGVLTLSKVIDKLKLYTSNEADKLKILNINGEDGASKLFKLLVEECTHLNLWVGKAVNPAHQNPALPVDLSIKLKLVEDLQHFMKVMGKEVRVNYL